MNPSFLIVMGMRVEFEGNEKLITFVPVFSDGHILCSDDNY